MESEKQIPKLGETRNIPADKRNIYAMFAHSYQFALLAEMDFKNGTAYVYHSAGNNVDEGWAEVDIELFVSSGGFPIEFAKPLSFPKAYALAKMFEMETKLRVTAEERYERFSGAVRRIIMDSMDDGESIMDSDRELLSFLND